LREDPPPFSSTNETLTTQESIQQFYCQFSPTIKIDDPGMLWVLKMMASRRLRLVCLWKGLIGKASGVGLKRMNEYINSTFERQHGIVIKCGLQNENFDFLKFSF
jgi:hypothetical protein